MTGDQRSTPSSAFHTANFGAERTAALAAALDHQAEAEGVRRLRAWAHGALAARAGERAVDVGCGTGSETQVLAAAVGPEGEAVGVEPNPGLRELAERRAAEAGSGARFVPGDAYALPFGDGEVDVVWCERVLQHLDEPDRAVAEIARILRPGVGRVALLDTDWATAVLHPADPEVADALTACMRAAAANPFAGRRLAGHLSAAGLTLTELGSQALIAHPTRVPWPIIRGLATSAVGRSLITPAQRDQLYADLTEASARSAFHFSVTIFGAIGRSEP